VSRLINMLIYVVTVGLESLNLGFALYSLNWFRNTMTNTLSSLTVNLLIFCKLLISWFLNRRTQ